MDWIDIRYQLPTKPGFYKTCDEEVGQSGKSYFDGIIWDKINHNKGSLLACEKKVSHWKELDSNDGSISSNAP